MRFAVVLALGAVAIGSTTTEETLPTDEVVGADSPQSKDAEPCDHDAEIEDEEVDEEVAVAEDVAIQLGTGADPSDPVELEDPVEPEDPVELVDGAGDDETTMATVVDGGGAPKRTAYAANRDSRNAPTKENLRGLSPLGTARQLNCGFCWGASDLGATCGWNCDGTCQWTGLHWDGMSCE